MAAIDKLFCNTLFEQKFPLAFVTAKTKAGSDHVPLILDFGCHKVKKSSLFRFEKWWLEQPDFKQLVNKIWNTKCVFEDAMEVWQFKIRLLRKKIKGWAININANIKKQKSELLKEFDSLDRRYESGILSPREKERMERIVCELEKIWSLEEIKARQRSRDMNVKEGDKNTVYFQAIANQRARKKRIPALEGPDGILDETKDMLIHAVDFYKILFGVEEHLGVHLVDNFWDEEDKVSTAENELSEAPLTKEEIKNAIFDSYTEGTPGPDGFPFLFYQTFWDTIKYDLMDLVKDFESGHLNLDRLNYVMITLIPKEAEAKHLYNFRPISLVNCSFKIFAKAMNNKLTRVADICANQTAFLKGWFILESMVAAHEIIH